MGEPPRETVPNAPPRASDLTGARAGETAGREAIFDRVSSLLEEGRLHEAEELLSRGLEIYPEDVDLLKELGVLYHLRGWYGKAARTFTRVMNITGGGKESLSWKITSLYHKALEEFEGPDPGRSIPSFDQILALDPSDGDALAGKIAALRVLGCLDEAQHCVVEGLSLDPPGPSVFYQEGWLRMDQDQPNLASGAFKRASLADPAWPDPVFSRALAMVRLGQGADAERLLQAFVESGQGTPGLRSDLGWFLLTLHEPDRARGIFMDLSEREGDPGGFHGMAALLLGTGWTGDAKAIMERVADTFPRDPLIQVNHAMVLARAGGGRELADATVSARRALTLSPRFGPAHTCLGIVASRQGKLDAAEEHFARAAGLSDPSGHRNLGLLACARGRWGEAEPHLLRALHLDPLDARAWAGLGALALKAGKTDEALPYLRRANMLDPHDTGTIRGLSIALARSGDLTGAEDVLRKAPGFAHGPARPVLLLDLAAFLLSAGGPAGSHVLDEEAGEVLTEAGALSPDEPGILFYGGVAEARLGNPEEAIRRFTAAMGHGEYRIPSQENIRRLKGRRAGGRGFSAGLPSPRSALALFTLLQLAAAWSFLVARLISETAFLLLVAIFSGLFALILFVPARNGGAKEETAVELVIPERTFVPAPVAEMVPPFVRLRTSLRPRSLNSLMRPGT